MPPFTGGIIFYKGKFLIVDSLSNEETNYYTTSKIYCTFLIACRMACGDGSGVRSLLS